MKLNVGTCDDSISVLTHRGSDKWPLSTVMKNNQVQYFIFDCGRQKKCKSGYLKTTCLVLGASGSHFCSEAVCDSRHHCPYTL